MNGIVSRLLRVLVLVPLWSCSQEENAIGAWFFCQDDSCATFGDSGVLFRENGTYAEVFRGSSTDTYCESPAPYSCGSYSWSGHALTGEPQTGDAFGRWFDVMGDHALLTYPKAEKWEGGSFLLRRIGWRASGPCFDKAAPPKPGGKACIPTGAFHGNQSIPPTIPRMDESAECQSGHCMTIACLDGKTPSVCARSTCAGSCPDPADTCLRLADDLGGGSYCIPIKAACP